MLPNNVLKENIDSLLTIQNRLCVPLCSFGREQSLPKASAIAVTSRKLKLKLLKISATVGLNILAKFMPKVKYSGLFSWVMSEISYIFVGFMPIYRFSQTYSQNSMFDRAYSIKPNLNLT